MLSSRHTVTTQYSTGPEGLTHQIINPQITVISDPFWYNPDENVLLIDCAICLSIVFLSISGQSFFFQCSMCVCLNHLYLCLTVTNLCALSLSGQVLNVCVTIQ